MICFTSFSYFPSSLLLSYSHLLIVYFCLSFYASHIYTPIHHFLFIPTLGSFSITSLIFLILHHFSFIFLVPSFTPLSSIFIAPFFLHVNCPSSPDFSCLFFFPSFRLSLVSLFLTTFCLVDFSIGSYFLSFYSPSSLSSSLQVKRECLE
jgi:hypothetical protein